MNIEWDMARGSGEGIWRDQTRRHMRLWPSNLSDARARVRDGIAYHPYRMARFPSPNLVRTCDMWYHVIHIMSVGCVKEKFQLNLYDNSWSWYTVLCTGWLNRIRKSMRCTWIMLLQKTGLKWVELENGTPPHRITGSSTSRMTAEKRWSKKLKKHQRPSAHIYALIV